MIARILPGWISRLTRFTATRAPKRTLTPSTSRRGPPPFPLINSPRTAGPQPRDVLRLALRRSSHPHRALELRLPDLHVGAHGARPAVLVGDLRLHRHMVGVRVQSLDERRVLLGDEPPPNLARPGDLLVVLVELLVEDQVLPDLSPPEELLLAQAPVDAHHLLADEVMHLRLLREVRVAGVWDVPPLRPVAHSRQVDVEHRGDIGP